MIRKLRIATFKFLDVLMILSMVLSNPINVAAAPQAADASPTLTTEHADYAPGETAHVTGAGFTPGDYVLALNSADTQWNVTADSDGKFTSDSADLTSEGDNELRAYASDWSGDWSETPLASASFTVTAPPPPTDTPTEPPTDVPTDTPTTEPTATQAPTDTPTDEPTATATDAPTDTPTSKPTKTPTDEPTATTAPTDTPTDQPTATSEPTGTPTDTPTTLPTDTPTSEPTNTPTNETTVTATDTQAPTDTPTNTATATQTLTSTPTDTPTSSGQPTIQSDFPDYNPGQLVTLTGMKWQGDTTVTITVVDAVPTVYHDTDQVQVQADGTITDSFNLPTSFVDRYFVTAKGAQTGRTATTTFTDANPSADLDQCANDPAPSPNTDGCNISATQWDNGNLNASKSVYFEGDSVPYRMKFDSLSLASHTVTIKWDTTKSGKHALDYLTSFNRTVANANPCLGVAGCSLGTFTTFPIPADPQVTGAGVTPAAGNFTLFGGTITAVSVYSYPDGAGFSGDKSAQITITFTTSVVNPVLAWGGHIATRSDWGAGNSAIAITGSPYHMRLVALDGSGGNQDRSLSADAVIFPGSITVIKDAIPNDAQDFSFTTTGGLSPATFSLDDDSDGTLSNTRLYSGITNFTTYTVAEANPTPGFDLTGLTCSLTGTGSTTPNLGTRTASINLQEGDNATCTFTNTKRGHIVVDKVTNPSGDPTSFTFTTAGSGYSGFSLTDAAAPNDQTLTPGNYSVSETVPSGWTSSSVCTSSIGDTETPAAIELDAGETVTCTFTNTKQQGTLTVNKVLAPSNDTGKFNLQIDGATAGTGANVGNGGTTGSITVSPGNHTVGETAGTSTSLSNYDTTINCGSGSVSGTSTTLNVPASGNVVCTITNSRKPTLTVNKILLPNSDSGKFNLQIDGATAGTGGNVGNGGTTGAVVVSVGTHTVSETAGTGTNLSNYVTTIGGDCASNGSVTLAAGDNKVCTITNSRRGTITIIKNTVPDDQQDFSYSTTGGLSPSTFSLDDDADNALSNTQTFNNVAPGLYTVTEGSAAGFDLTGLSCTASTGSSGGQDNSNAQQANISLAAGGSVTCTFTNTKQNPALTLVKTAMPSTYSSVGQVISYSYLVTNSGNVKLAGPVTVTDDKATATCPNVNTVGNHDGFLDSGESVTCTASYTITQVDINNGSVTNTAMASAGGTNSNQDSETVTAIQTRTLSLVKTATPATYSTVGDVISYSYQVTNTGNVTLAGPVTVTDDKATVTCPAGGLAPGAFTTCTASYTITQADLDSGSVKNTAQAHANGIDSNFDDETVTATQTRMLSLVKTATPTTYSAVGDVISYSYVVKNTGNVTLAGPVTVTDDKTTVSCPAGGLVPGASMTCTATYTITQADLDNGSVKNTAQAHANGVDSNFDDETVTATQTRTLSLVKTATPATYSAVGDVISYSYVVKNTGNVTLAGPVTVTDDKTTVSCPAGGLAPSASMTCTATYTITQADLDNGSVKNTAQAHANGIDSNFDDETVTATQTRTLSLVKTATPATYSAVGDVISYSYVVKNTGNVTLSGPVTVTDDKATVTCPAGGLAPGASMTCTASYTITQADLNAGSVKNTAQAHANGTNSNFDDETVTAVQSPALSLDKTATPSTYSAVGDEISYNYNLKNTGNVTLSGPFTVTDDKATVTCPATTSLAPNASIDCTASYTITQADLDAGSVTNTATGHASFNGNDVDSNEDSTTVTGEQNPHLSITKTDDLNPAKYDHIGQNVTYTITATNDGNVTLHNVTVTDSPALDGFSCTPSIPVASLAPGDSISCTGTHSITQADLDAGSFLDTGTADSDETTPVDAPDTISADQSAVLTLTKTDDLNPAKYDHVGQVVTYTLTATNNGNVTLHNVTVTDSPALDGFSCTPSVPVASLAPGDSISCTGTHSITQADLDAGFFKDTGSASSTEDNAPDADDTVNADQSAVLTLTKTDDLNPAKYDHVGQVVTYTLTATNDGNVTLHNVTVTDSPALDGFSCTPSVPVASLAPGDSISCTGTHSITQADLDAGSFLDTGTADSDETTPVDAPDTISADQSAVLTLTKTDDLNPAKYDHVGQVVTYTLTATNDGNVTLHNVTVTDSPALDGFSCTPSVPVASLAPGDSISCTGTHSITQADLDAGSFLDTGTADSDETTPVDAPDTISADQSAVLTLTKTDDLNPAKYDHVGQVVTYTLTATNDGNVTLHNVTVTDSPALDGFSCTPSVPVASLAPGDSISCTGTHSITQADLDAGFFKDTGSASSTEDNAPDADDTVNADQSAVLTLTKTDDLNPAKYDHIGQNVTYTITATNDGNVTLHNVTVTDSPALDGFSCTPSVPVASLAPGDSISCTGTHSITQADLDAGSFLDTGTADSDETTPVDAPDTISADQSAVLTLTKTDDLNPAKYDHVGQVVTYTLTATNDGNVTLHNVTVTDSPALDGFSCTPSVPVASLAPGDSISCTGTHSITQADLDAGFFKDTGSASSTEDNAPDADDTVNADQSAVLTLTKTDDLNPAKYDHVGQVVTYTLTATNDGNVTLHNVTVTDSPALDGFSCTPSVPVASLAPGDSISCTGTHSITQADLDAGFFKDTGSASGTEDNAPDADDTVNADQSAVLTLTKTDDLNPAKYDHVGQVVTYTLTATNDGNVTLHNVTVTDSPALDGFSCTPSVPVASLAPGDSISCTGTHSITQADLDAGSFLDTGTADSDETTPVDAPDTISADQSAVLTLTKTDDLNPAKYDHVGQVVTYTLTATNNGNITLHNVTVTDSPALDGFSCTPSVPVASLAPGDSISCTGTHSITQADLDAGFFKDTGSASSTEDNAPDADDTVNADQSAVLTLTKTDDLNPAKYDHVGQVVTYTLTATNDGNVTLHNVTVTDSPALDGFSCTPSVPVASLAPGDSISCTGTHSITQADLDAGFFKDTGSASSTEDNAPDADDTVNADQSAVLTLTKTDDLNPAKYDHVGQVVTYTLTATNDGNVTLHNVTVTDSPALDGFSCTPSVPVASLAPGDSISCTGTHSITQADLDAGSFLDTGTADSDETTPVDAPDTISADQSAVLTLTKTDDLNPAKYDHVGQVVTYTLTATNDGNITLHNVTVTDSPALDGFSCTPSIPVASLAPGDSISCTGTHSITQADLDAGFFKDTGSASSTEDNAPDADDTVNADQSAVLTLTKTDDLNPAKYDHVGQVVTYTLTATNDGNVTLHNVTVTDSPALDGFSCTPSVPVASLAPGDSISCTGTHSITQADLDAGFFKDTGSASGTEDNAPDADDTVNADQSAVLTLTKTDDLNPAKYDHVGQVVTYTLTATNDGNVTLHNVTVTDSPALDGFSCTPSVPVASLAPGNSISCTGTHSITQADLDAGFFKDTGTADSEETTPVDAPDTIHAAPRLIVIKHVTNNNGGTKTAADFTMTVDDPGTNPPSFAGAESPGTIVVVDAGAYTVSETGPSGYSASFSADCTGTIAIGETKTCTVTNDDQAATLIVIKHVVNDNGGTATAADFTLDSGGTNDTPDNFAGAETPGTNVTLNAGSYAVTETGPSGYSASFSADCTGSIANGQTKTCTVTNDDIAPKLIVIKHVINNNGRTAVASDFTLDSGGANDTPDNFAGNEAGTTVTLDVGSYNVTETGPSGYVASYSADCLLGSIALGETKTCTVTNDDLKFSPTIATNASAGGVVGIVILKDSATLSGGNNPTGTITFTLKAPDNSVVDTETVTVIGNGIYTTPVGYLAVQPGTYTWSATYSGDNNNNGATDDGTNETVTVGSASPAVNTIAGGTVVVGSGAKLTDTAVLSGGFIPSGTITFTLYNPAHVAVYTDVVTVSGNGSYDTSTGTNPGGYLPTATGTYLWSATYSGDSNNNSATDNGQNENEIVSPASPAINTVAGGTVVIGSGTKLSDTAVLSGGYNPTGTITFTLYNPSNVAVYTDVVTVTGNGTYTTASGNNPGGYLPTTTGTYLWKATYSGDSNNNSATDNGQNESEMVTKATPTLTTTASGPAIVGQAIHDTATLAGGYGTLGGTLTFDVFAPGDTTCSTPISVPPSKSVTGTGSYTSGNYTATSVGVYRWIAHYSGDANNNLVNTACNDANETSTVNKASPSITTTPNPSTGTVGVALNDSANVTGGFNPTGSVTFKLYSPADATCSSTPAYQQTVALSGGSASTSPGFVSNAAGTWRWTATYSGDANNNTASSGCQAEKVTVNKASPGITTTPNPSSGKLGATVTSAKLSGGFSPTGTIVFKLYPPSNTTCSGTPAYQQTVIVNGNGTYNTSPGFVSNASGTWRWTATYSGDVNNNTAVSGCNAELVQIEFHPGTIGFWKNWRNKYTSAQIQSLINYLKTNNPKIYNKDLVSGNSDDLTIAKLDAIFNVGSGTPRDQMILAQVTALKLNLAITQLNGTGGLVQYNDNICLAGTINVSGISGAATFFGTSTPTIQQVVNAVESKWTGNLTTNRNDWKFNFSSNTQKDMIINVLTGINEGTIVTSSGCP